MKTIIWKRIKKQIVHWRLGDYFRQFSVVVAGIVVTFCGSDLINEHARQKQVRATMLLVVEELEHNREELDKIKQLMNVDIYMSSLLIEQQMDASGIPVDTLFKYGKFFNNMSGFDYSTDALDVLKGSSLMQDITDKRLLQDVLQAYYKLGKIQKDINDYYQIKKDVLLSVSMSMNKESAMNKKSFKELVVSLLGHDKFVNYTLMVPGFLYWDDFNNMDDMLQKQIYTLEEKYKKPF